MGDEGVLVFIFDMIEPIQNSSCVLPLRLRTVIIFLLMQSRICLLIFPISDFVDLISLQVGLLLA